ncbi:hypothetical protein [Actinophytocola glycyrrhizae]|uniref:Uncharacterized protein n=1 Tax=Actinophytocola glycyrrhizae TaxID=2044873 RepID=A0ABV9S0N4_9PSEU
MAIEAAQMTATRPIPGPRTVMTAPDIRPRAGHDLLMGVDKVLARLAEPDDTLGLADDLRTALARTAALGDSCRIRQQCDGVRLAADLLLAGEVVDAHAILVRTQTELTDQQQA